MSEMPHGCDENPWDREYSLKGNLWHGRPAELPSLPTGSNVLELGCGNGKNMREMVRRAWHVVGIDISPAALELCRNNLGGMGDCSIIHGDARSLSFENGTFDAVFAVHVLEHFLKTDRRVVLDEAVRVLSPGGRLFIRVFSNEDMRCGKGVRVEPGTYRRQSGILVHYFSSGELLDLMEDVGLAVVSGPEQVSWDVRIEGDVFTRGELSLECKRG